ncbi:MAG: hypothetical protein JO288_14555 [Hyphomicrobiales bacterium]|nr:hypothetical protein [Hyphomicrobiales bacterium]
MQPSLFTRLAVAEAQAQAMKDALAEVVEMLAEVRANQDELRQDHDEWKQWAERLLTDQRKSSWRRIGGWMRRPARLPLPHSVSVGYVRSCASSSGRRRMTAL